MPRATDLVGSVFATSWHAERLYRLSERWRSSGHPVAALACLGIYHVIIGVVIVPGAQLGDGLVITHGSGIVIAAKSRSEAIV